MPKQSTKVEVNRFIQGIVTEASPLNFPKDATLDEQNFELGKDGVRKRRKGIQYELNGANVDVSDVSLDPAKAAISSYKWLEAGGVPENNFLVIQTSNRLSFFDLNKVPITTAGFAYSFLLDELPANKRFSMTSVDGMLIIASGSEKICLVEFKDGALSFSYSRIRVRDLWGIQVT